MDRYFKRLTPAHQQSPRDRLVPGAYLCLWRADDIRPYGAGTTSTTTSSGGL